MEGVALRSAFLRIGFSTDAAHVTTDSHGIDIMEELAIITDGYIENLYKVTRRPAGINPINFLVRNCCLVFTIELQEAVTDASQDCDFKLLDLTVTDHNFQG